MTAALNGWHPGETELQRKLGFADAVRDNWALVKNAMSEQHRIFHTSDLHFIPVTTLDDHGRPWGSLLAGEGGSVGFVTSPDDTTLIVDAAVWPGDPVLTTITAFLETQRLCEKSAPERFLIAGIGIEHATRRRNKFAGRLRRIQQNANLEGKFRLDFEVNQALGNCPKYINLRNLIPHHNTRPSVAYQNLDMAEWDRMPDEVIRFITEADTVFLASLFKPQSSTKAKYPSHAGMNIRGGLPGFMRVNPSDARTVVLPDYSGNRYMSSLGNIIMTPLAGLTIVDFKTGDMLYLTGTAQVLTGPVAMEIMPRQACLTVVKVTGCTFVRNALPVRQEPGTHTEGSPYSPKVKYLCAKLEGRSTAEAESDRLKARLTYATKFAHDIAILRFEIIGPPGGSRGLKIRPGQAVVLDFMDWVGPPVYKHMATDAPGSINDDRVRTWTVSSAHGDGNTTTTWFEMTMREAKNGAVTGALFRAIDGNTHNNWERTVRIDNAKDMIAEIVGVTGDFHLGTHENETRMLWVAGGIGLTPFMAMLTAITTATNERGSGTKADVVLALATREPEVFLKLIKTSLAPRPLTKAHQVRVDIFTNQNSDFQTFGLQQMNVDIVAHKGRIPMEYWRTVSGGRDVFICGPGGFGDAAEAGLRGAGVSNDKIYREGFY